MLTIQISDLLDSKFMLRYYWTPTPFHMVGEVNDERLSQKAAAFGQVMVMVQSNLDYPDSSGPQ